MICLYVSLSGSSKLAFFVALGFVRFVDESTPSSRR
jgi:hypothetical protein